MHVYYIQLTPEEAQLVYKLIKLQKIKNSTGKNVSIGKLLEIRIKNMIKDEIQPYINYLETQNGKHNNSSDKDR